METITDRLTRDRVKSELSVSVSNSYFINLKTRERGRFNGGGGVCVFSVLVLVYRVSAMSLTLRVKVFRLEVMLQRKLLSRQQLKSDYNSNKSSITLSISNPNGANVDTFYSEHILISYYFNSWI